MGVSNFLGFLGGGSLNLARPGVGTGEADTCAGVRKGRLVPGVGRVRLGVDNLAAVADMVIEDREELDRKGVAGLCGVGIGILGDGGGVGRERPASMVSLVGWVAWLGISCAVPTLDGRA